MRGTRRTIIGLIAGILLSIAATSNADGQSGPPAPDPGTNQVTGDTNTVDLTSFYSNNLASVSEWLHTGYALPDGTPADFQTIMDQSA
jgi:hypothetical protein